MEVSIMEDLISLSLEIDHLCFKISKLLDCSEDDVKRLYGSIYEKAVSSTISISNAGFMIAALEYAERMAAGGLSFDEIHDVIMAEIGGAQ